MFRPANLVNEIMVLCARRRWLKRLALPIMPNHVHSRIYEKVQFHYDPRDMKGPSFHFGHDLEKGFNNYEEVAKNELINLIPQGGSLYDVGANIGMFSVYCALKRPDVKLRCFEPEKNVFNCLQRNMDQFKNSDIKIFNVALGPKKQKGKLYKSGQNDGGHSLLKESLGQEKGINEHQIVDVVSLDDDPFFDEKIHIDCLKIDVEGFELEVLKGMENHIRQNTPHILMETNNLDLAKKGPLYQKLSEWEDLGLYARVPGELKQLDLIELSTLAKKSVDNKTYASNYFFQFHCNN